MPLNSTEPLHQFVTADVEFLCEQDGPAERQLKEALATLLGDDAGIERAYLACARYDGQATGVVLGLKARAEDEQLMRRIGDIFAAMFKAGAHLDIIFLSDERDAKLALVCPPFYSRAGRPV